MQDASKEQHNCCLLALDHVFKYETQSFSVNITDSPAGYKSSWISKRHWFGSKADIGVESSLPLCNCRGLLFVARFCVLWSVCFRTSLWQSIIPYHYAPLDCLHVSQSGNQVVDDLYNGRGMQDRC